MQTMNRDDVVLKSVDIIKKGEFKGTAIKVELEATFNRGNTHGRGGWEYCDYCEHGSNTCDDCDGDWADGRFQCIACDGIGHIRTAEYYDWLRARNAADEAGEPFSRSEPPRVACDSCDETGFVANCPVCEEGRLTCSECLGDYRWRSGWRSEDCDEPADDEHPGDGTDWSSNATCHDFIMKEMAKLGLATLREDANPLVLSHGVSTRWHPKGALKYAEFYTDGSVDSELTFTISLEDRKNVYLLPKVIAIWNKLGETIGEGVNLERAGMHTAILQDPDWKYPIYRTPSAQQSMFDNYRKSMNLLMPALFFFGSNTDKSRGMRFRMPQASGNEKYSAIHYAGQALEFRVFNTCYDNPDSILDIIVVMANSLRYWSKVYKPSGLSKVANDVRFGNDDGDKLERLYVTEKHIDLLNAGLQKLKPSYYTIRELKKQRSFTRDRRLAKKWLAEKRKAAEEDFKEYEARRKVERAVRMTKVRAEFMEQMARSAGRYQDVDPDTLADAVEQSVQEWATNNQVQISSMEEYVTQQLDEFERRMGCTRLREEVEEPQADNGYTPIFRERAELPF